MVVKLQIMSGSWHQWWGLHPQVYGEDTEWTRWPEEKDVAVQLNGDTICKLPPQTMENERAHLRLSVWPTEYQSFTATN